MVFYINKQLARTNWLRSQAPKEKLSVHNREKGGECLTVQQPVQMRSAKHSSVFTLIIVSSFNMQHVNKGIDRAEQYHY